MPAHLGYPGLNGCTTVMLLMLVLLLLICSAIRQSLIASGKFEAALLVSNKYQLDKAGVYASWGMSELSLGGQEHFKLARDRFKYYYQVCVYFSAVVGVLIQLMTTTLLAGFR